jgi:membrane protein
VITWILFSFIYIFLPNTKVKFKTGIWAGIVIGTLFQIVQWSYISMQVGVAKYNAIYGSFAAIPLFIIWLQLSWLIVLLGAEISFFHQNFESYEHEHDSSKISFMTKKLISLQIVTLILKNFIKSDPPLTLPQISHKLEIPARLLQQLLYDLQVAGILSEIKTEQDQDIAFQPAKDPQSLNIASIVTALERNGINETLTPKTASLESYQNALEAFERAIDRSTSNKKISDFTEKL